MRKVIQPKGTLKKRERRQDREKRKQRANGIAISLRSNHYDKSTLKKGSPFPLYGIIGLRPITAASKRSESEVHAGLG